MWSIRQHRCGESEAGSIGAARVVLKRRATGVFREPSAWVPTLIETLDDENAEVRRFAAYALGEIGSTEALEPLTQALNDPNAGVRRAAANAIREILD